MRHGPVGETNKYCITPMVMVFVVLTDTPTCWMQTMAACFVGTAINFLDGSWQLSEAYKGPFRGHSLSNDACWSWGQCRKSVGYQGYPRLGMSLDRNLHSPPLCSPVVPAYTLHLVAYCRRQGKLSPTDHLFGRCLGNKQR